MFQTDTAPTVRRTVAAPAADTPCRGRERSCRQCAAVYRSARSNSLYCSAACRKKAARGTAPTGGPKAGPQAWSVVGRLLLRGGFVGLIGPLSRRDLGPKVYGLTVEADTAHRELADLFNRRGWGILSRAEFDAALKADGVQGYSTRSPEAAERKRWQDRQRLRAARS